MNKRITRNSLLTLIITLAGNTLMAQDTIQLNLQQAIDKSIENSKQLKLSKAKIDETTAMLTEANDSKLPDLKISGSYMRLSKVNLDLKLGSDTTTAGGGPSINQILYSNANLSIPLYAGGRIKYGIESAKLLQQASRLDADNDKEAVIFNTTKAYINLYKSFEAVYLVKENLQSSLSRDSTLYNLEKNGLLARNDLLKARLQTSNIELSLLDIENSSKMAMVNMNLLLGLPENTTLLIDSSFINSKQEFKNFPDYESLALQSRKDIQALAIRKKAAATGIKSARAEEYPTVALTGGYIAAYIPNFLTITNAFNIGVGLQYNLSSLWKKNAKLLQAQARQQQVNASEEILTDAVRLQVNQDYQNYLLSYKKIAVYEKAYEQAMENYRITNNKYNNSLVTITDLLDANVSLLQSKLNIRFAKADVVLAYNKLLQTTGSLSK